MRFYYDNKWIGTGGTITASSEASGYPVTALDDYIVATKWRATSDSDEWVKIDFGSAVSITDVTIIDHNFTNAATVKIQGNASDSWGSPSVDETITWRDYIMDKNFTGGSYQWWRVHIADAANTDTYVELGYLFIGNNLTLGDIIEREFSLMYLENSLVHETRTGQVYGDQGISRRLWAFNLPHIEGSEIMNLNTMWNSVGKYRPFVLFIDETDTVNNPPAFGRFSENWDWNHITRNIYNLSFPIVEVF